MRDAFVAEARSLLSATDDVAVVLADISADRFADAGPRAVNVGIREQAMIGVAGGLALAGVHPVVHTYAPFLVERAWEQVKLDLSHQDVGATLVSIGASYDASSVGRTHHSPGDVALLDTLRDWRIEVPSHPDEIAPLLRRAVAARDRTYLRLAEDVAARPGPVDGSLRVLRRGRRGVVLAVGPLVDRVVEATAGLDLTVLHAVTVRPLDLVTLRREVILGDVADVVLVEPYLSGTSTAVVTDALSDRPHRVFAHGVGRPDLHRFGTRADHDRAHRLDIASLREDIGAELGLAGFASPTWSGSVGNLVSAH
jgi:transketolase